MKAAVVERFGPPEVVQVIEVPEPEPGAREVLVRVHSAAVTAADARIRGAVFPRGFGTLARLIYGIRKPRRPILGGNFSGQIVALGREVAQFAVGDEVCGMTGMKMGAHAEYVSVATKRIVPKPSGVSHDDAAAVLFGGSTALCYLRDKAQVTPGQKVLVIGASGAVGTNAVQLARHFGSEVTAVTTNQALLQQLGADSVIDYTSTSVLDVEERFDVIFDTVGELPPKQLKRLLADDGVLLLAAASLTQTVSARGAVKAGPAPERAEDCAELLELVQDGHLRVVLESVVDLPGLPDAYRRIDSGRKVGNIVLHP